MLQPVATITVAELRGHRHPFVETQCRGLKRDPNDVIAAVKGKPDGTHRHDGLDVRVRGGKVVHVSPAGGAEHECDN